MALLADIASWFALAAIEDLVIHQVRGVFDRIEALLLWLDRVLFGAAALFESFRSFKAWCSCNRPARASVEHELDELIADPYEGCG